MMHKHLLLLVLLTFSVQVYAQKMLDSDEWCASHHKNRMPLLTGGIDGRSDSIDLIHAWISLDLSQVASQQIRGNCNWSFKILKSGVHQLRFDLLALQVDSVSMGGLPVTFQQIGESLFIPLAPEFEVNSTYDLLIFYHGTPQQDLSGWGGFYFGGGYAFNLGVGFAADPHVFGRAWFPCFDNFVERSTFNFDMYTQPSQPAYCNGMMQVDQIIPDGRRWRGWLLENPIPSYLACVAIGPYTSYKRTYPGETNPIPVEIAAEAGDTAKVRNTFQHLPQAIQAFEYWYGPYKWPKIGYSLVPFNSGAMEHATNIAIGKTYINGTLTYETLWAHELSHHWWGDLATCSTAEDMWLNEGWASYSEHLFTEWQYGKVAYRKAVKDNFLSVLQNSHVNEGGYLAVSGVPHSLTYGDHVYHKGAVVAHNLRAYMGDSLFRQGLRSALEQTNFKDWDSHQFKEKLETSTGLDLDDFFENWVFNGGFTDFLIDSSRVNTLGPSFVVKLYVKQKLRGAPAFFQNVPVEFTFLKPDHSRVYKTALISGETSVVEFLLDFNPKLIFVNTNLTLTLAKSDGEKSIVATGTVSIPDSRMNVSVNSMGGADSVLVRLEHHFVTPDEAGAAAHGYHLSTRFWEVQGVFPPAFDMQATITYDGRGQLDQLDKPLFDATGPLEDSVVVFYRQGAGHEWKIWPDFVLQTLASSTDKFGQLRILHLKPGQYAIGKGAASVGTSSPGAQPRIQLAPNPVELKTRVQSDQPFDHIQLLDASGACVRSWRFHHDKSVVVSLDNVPAGAYWLRVSGKNFETTTTLMKI